MKKERFFVRLSTTIGPSIMDWLRSVYFSLVGSSVLNLVLKITTYDCITNIVYISADLLLIAGLVFSVHITKRLKDYEKSYPDDVKDPKAKSFTQYCKEHESSQYLQHLGLYTLWFVALICLGYAGIRIEEDSTSSRLKIKQELSVIEARIDSLKPLAPAILRLHTGIDSLTQLVKNKIKPDSIRGKQQKKGSHVH